MSSHPAVVTVTPAGPLEIHNYPTKTPKGNEVKLVCQWTASTPLDLHQNDGHLMVTPPQILGDNVAGTVLSVGPDVKNFRPGDQVFGFTWRTVEEKAHQLYVVTTEDVIAKLPTSHTFQEAVVVPDNFVTAWAALIKEFGFELPWPKPQGYEPPEKDSWIFIAGGSSSVGSYTLQILKYYGYNRVLTTASKAQHDKLKKYGATECFDYRTGDVVDGIKAYVNKEGGRVDYILDCIGSVKASMEPASRVAQSGCKVAILLPAIIKDAAPGVKPEYEMDVEGCVPWAKGVKIYGVRTHFYMDNEFLAKKLQPEILPWALAEKIVLPNDQIMVEGKTLLERAEKALSMLRSKQVSGARLVWKVAEDEEVENALKQIQG